MRHLLFRLIIGIIWLLAAIISALTGNIPFAALYVVLGIVFLCSAYSLWKKEKDNGR